MNYLSRNRTNQLFHRAKTVLRQYSSVDCHTHMYTPKYMDILRKRVDIPRVLTIQGQDRLVILPGEDREITTSTGRAIGEEYWNVSAKIKYA